MPRLSGWKLARNKLSRTFEIQDFVQSLSFLNSLVAYFELWIMIPTSALHGRGDLRVDALRPGRKGRRTEMSRSRRISSSTRARS